MPQNTRDEVWCPMCLGTNMKPHHKVDKDEYIEREIWICPDCPCVVFEYHNQGDLTDVGVALGLKQVAK